MHYHRITITRIFIYYKIVMCIDIILNETDIHVLDLFNFNCETLKGAKMCALLNICFCFVYLVHLQTKIE